MELPEKCCAKCLHWRPNRVSDFLAGDEKTCWKHDKATEDEFYCEDFCGKDATEVNVPQTSRNGTMDCLNRNPVTDPVEIMIVTYGTPTLRVSGAVVSELDWLDYCLRGIARHCKGFQGTTVVHPNHETAMFLPFAQKYDIRLHGYDEVAGKGFVQHQVKHGEADLILPKSTKYVLHLDADVCCKRTTQPEHFFYEDKPIYIWRTYESLTTEDPRNPGSKVVSDCVQWRQPTEEQIGFPISAYTMTRIPNIFPIDFYPIYRAQIEKVHHMSFLDYFLAGKNEFPQNRMDWTAMGAFAFHKMRDRFSWFNCADGSPYPVDRFQNRWSHAGLTPQYIAEMEKDLA